VKVDLSICGQKSQGMLYKELFSERNQGPAQHYTLLASSSSSLSSFSKHYSKKTLPLNIFSAKNLYFDFHTSESFLINIMNPTLTKLLLIGIIFHLATAIYLPLVPKRPRCMMVYTIGDVESVKIFLDLPKLASQTRD
jgi:hypothetical protein